MRYATGGPEDRKVAGMGIGTAGRMVGSGWSAQVEGHLGGILGANMNASWHLIVSHWGTWTVSGITGFIGGLVGSAFRWRWPSWKEWQEERQQKRDKETDARVMALLDGNGSSTMFAHEISEKLGVDEDEVRDSLDRLEARGRIGMGSPTFTSPAFWFSLHR